MPAASCASCALARQRSPFQGTCYCRRETALVANAIRHGLFARCIVLGSESCETFDTLNAGFLERFNPADDVELGFLEEMVAALWRQRRAWAIGTKLMDDAVAAQPQLGLLHRYEARLHRVFQRALYNLLILRAETPPPSNCETNLVPNSDTPAKNGARENGDRLLCARAKRAGRAVCPQFSPRGNCQEWSPQPPPRRNRPD